MERILVTGFTGTVGQEAAKQLVRWGERPRCAVRNVEKALQQYGTEYEYAALDFDEEATFPAALAGVGRLFLMYPPMIREKDSFARFIAAAKQHGVRHIVYLSVKDVQYLPFVPHHKNEKLIKQSGIPYTFLRAGYFTQNLNLFLLGELMKHDRIFVPAGKGKTSFTDVRDIAEIGALALLEGEKHYNKSYVPTGSEALTFFEVADIMTKVLGRRITYTNPTVKEFQTYFRQEGLEEAYLKVVTGIHLFTKIGLAKGITRDIERVTGHPPLSVRQYVEDYRAYWEK
ncbi:SDR family oxidoreductase [Ectobacillus ponti]|uniref:SDR family oxidoreductase n=1 Tax=Ectobacillus ponti TaxID=2961894 RepID=A0AA41X2V8_9BACI|nr:SDR family oxidoreductase [Ectobacillus ponti]MCP8967687.1 SDR family oxidoreductase [Ectobacillus ponti]